jgi:hypothetical protein
MHCISCSLSRARPSLLFLASALALWLLAATLQPAAAQSDDDVDDLLLGGTADASTLIDAYFSPGITGFGAGLNTGWAGTAQPHGALAVHLRAGASLSRVPSGDRTFTLAPGDLEQLTIDNPAIGSSPTVAGEEDAPRYDLRLPSGDVITMPEGSGFPFAPTPVVGVGVGVGRDTELMLRLIPAVDIAENDGTISLVGAGVKHGLNQWLSGGAELPVDFSLMAHYARFNLDATLDEEAGHDLEWTTDAWAATALVGKSLPVLSVYGGVGVEASSTTIALKGTYEVEDEDGGLTSIEDPLDLDFDRGALLRALAGLQVRLGVFALHVEGTLADYASVTAGVGLVFD